MSILGPRKGKVPKEVSRATIEFLRSETAAAEQSARHNFNHLVTTHLGLVALFGEVRSPAATQADRQPEKPTKVVKITQ